MALDISRFLAKRGIAGLVLLAAVCLPLIAVMVQDVVRDLRLLRSASTDNMLWTLSQAEIEFQEFRRESYLVALGRTRELEQVRTEFDIFYSRVATLEVSAQFASLRAQPDFAAALAELRGFLDTAVPLIDGPDTVLRAEIRNWPPQLEELRTAVRALAISGLSVFAANSEARRDRIALTLSRVALLTTALILAMALMLVLLRRITDRLQERSRLLGAANTRLNTILDTTHDGIVVADRHGRILQFNAAAEAMFGRSAAEVTTLRFTRFLREGPGKGDAGGTLRLQDLAGRGQLTMEGLRPDGTAFPIEIALARAEAGGEDIFICSVSDISESVAAARELVEAHDQAVAGEKAKSDFLAVMTHEIRTPLTGLLGNLNLMQTTEMSEDQTRYSRNMAISGDILMRQVDAVMDLTRLEAQPSPRPAEPVHLGQLLQDVVDGQSSAALARGTQLSWHWIGAPVGWVSVDPVPLEQILLNLVGNAIKFTEAGQVTIEAEALPEAPDPGQVAVEMRVIDTGIGIEEAALETVFDDFTTVDTSYRRKTGGTGLGLAIARRLTESLGGEIGAESTPGVGSVFWLRLTLPRAAAPADGAPREARDVAPNAAPGPLDILVVEDNDINRDLVREMLETLGHRPVTVADGQAGVAMAMARRFDLILMDIAMPVMDGLEAARRIHASEGPSAGSPILALSANVLARNQARFAAAGLQGFLEKPFTRDALHAAITGAILDPAVSDPAPAPQHARPSGPSEATVAKLHAALSAEVADLADWLSQADPTTPGVDARCHKIAGTAAALEHVALRDALIAIEEAAVEGDAGAFRRLVIRLQRLVAQDCPDDIRQAAPRRAGA
ncbi:PAS domain S-box-containing protein [Roseivivax lentus]|uniref:histidine kinase n=1 Tax=Roseivivax lentus TaxID=633194 RepID=A0A1N7N8A2_9RHOB|nr:ATP-binding protein [Roseivivax lentus]SIS94575.1 PAS domain S-box-containing protein [Roseivivax lentus]